MKLLDTTGTTRYACLHVQILTIAHEYNLRVNFQHEKSRAEDLFVGDRETGSVMRVQGIPKSFFIRYSPRWFAAEPES